MPPPARAPSDSERRLAQAHALRARHPHLPPEGLPAADILDSWARCDAAGLDFARPPAIQVVEQAELARRREALGVLRRFALAELETLMPQIAGSNFLLTFADRDGVILDLYADERFLTSDASAGLQVGGCWAEALTGTNGLGTALALERPVAVNGLEHYCLRHADISCTAAPIRDAWGRVVGALDASSYVQSRQRHTQALVQLAATQLENSLLCQQMSAHLVLALHPRREFLGTASAGLLAFDSQGRLAAHNARAASLLTGLDLQAGTPFESLFDDAHYARLVGRFDREHRLGRPAEVALRDRLGSRLVLRPVHLPPIVLPVALPAGVGGADVQAPTTAIAPPVAATAATAVAAGATATATPSERQAAPQDDRPPTPAAHPAPPAARRAAAGTHAMPAPDFVADDPRVQHTLALLAGAVRLRVPVLILGETGTGKELLARHAHRLSGRRGAFVGVNCAAMPEGLFEAELFGYAAGAYTGAQRQGHAGLIASADGGTLLLDELAELPPRLQAALLRFLDDQQLRPVGSTRTRQVDVQVLAATHGDLETATREGRFRADLLNRLNIVRLALPPLRERADFVALAEATLATIDPHASFGRAALQRLADQPWPGNLRELRAVLTRALLLRPDGLLDAAAFDGLLLPAAAARPQEAPAAMAPAGVSSALPAVTPAELEAHVRFHDGAPAPSRSMLQAENGARIRHELARSGGSVSEAARRLGISRTTVYRYLRQETGAAGPEPGARH